MKGIIAGAVLGLGLISQSYAEVLIDVRNDTSEDCSLAVNARIDKPSGSHKVGMCLHLVKKLLSF